jgi:hypothetical protein
MLNVRREIRRDVASGRLWALEVFGHEIIGCLGPFGTEAAIPPHLDRVAFERNGELLRWLRRNDLRPHSRPD